MTNVQNQTVCEKCTGDGIIYVANGPDDTDEEFCGCEKGKELKQEAERLTTNND